jgi:hypothetical protein
MKVDRIASVIFILAGIVFWTNAEGLQYNCMIFPRLLALFLILLSGGLFAETFIMRATTDEVFVPRDVRYILVSVAVVIVWVYLLSIAGFIVSSIVFLTLLTLILDLQQPTLAGTVSTVAIYSLMVFSFWLIFHKFLLVPLPTGYLI